MIQRILGRVSLLAVLCVFSTGAMAQVDFTVRAKVDEEAGKLLIQPTNYCPNSNSDGCLEMDDFSLIRFRLVQSAGWSFTRMFICEGNTKAAPSTCSMGRLERLQFVAGTKDDEDERLQLPNKRGLINLRPLLPEDPQNNDLDVFFLYNANNTAKNYFYMLEACKGGGNTECVRTDPPMRNKGRGSNR